jgi:hypothetical protein
MSIQLGGTAPDFRAETSEGPVEASDRIDPWEQELDLSIEEPGGSVDGDGEHAREREAALDRGEP